MSLGNAVRLRLPLGWHCRATGSPSGIGSNIDSILKNALAHEKAMDELASCVRKAIHNECLAGGIIWQRFNR